MVRIVSLIPSATEIVCALGFESSLVGRSHECDFPPTVTRLPELTEPKFNPEGSSAAIDKDVKRILEQALSVYRVHAQKLAELRPDVIVTQSQCEVCAVSLAEVERVVRESVDSHPQIVSLSPNSLSDVLDDIRKVGVALKAGERAQAVIEGLESRMRAIAQAARSLKQRPRMASIEWIDPLMSGGNWMPELTELAGGINIFGVAGEHSPRIGFADLCRADPDVILISPCGFTMERTRDDLPELMRKTEWTNIAAVKNHRVYLADGHQYFNRPGPRLVESLEILTEILHPGQFHFGHEGTGWQRV